MIWIKLGWKPVELLYLKDNLWLGNLTLTLQDVRNDPGTFDSHSFESFASSVEVASSLYGFFTTTRLLNLSTSAKSVTYADQLKRHKTLMLLAQQSWGVIHLRDQAELTAVLHRLPHQGMPAGIWCRQLDLARVEPEAAEAANEEQGETELDRILNSSTPQLDVGVRVMRISGLRSEAVANLNGKMGKIIKFDAKQERYNVQVDGETKLKGMKAANIESYRI